jgi:beta-glucosidase/6-phospho-beta-glucosidase/beta-galactosidase
MNTEAENGIAFNATRPFTKRRRSGTVDVSSRCRTVMLHPTVEGTKIGPEALYWGPRNVAKVWNASEIYITENGCSASDVLAAER